MLDLSRATDAALLDSAFCELPITLDGSAVATRAARVHATLAARDLRCRPGIWLAEEWFNPDGTVGFGIPFYLMHPRLVRLERRMMHEAEGATEAECMRILRHETGHAVDEAYQLFRTADYRRTFGSPRRRYPTAYAVRPASRDFVTHLNAWYAQAHPLEDFAETFAVWLTPRAAWRRRYAGWPALAKLEQVDRWMRELAGQPPALTDAAPREALADNRRTLREHYAEKRAFYAVEDPERFDPALERLFAAAAPSRRGSAARVIAGLRPAIRDEVARPLGVPAYTVDQILLRLIGRARTLRLRGEPAPALRPALTALVRELTLDAINQGEKLPL